MDIITKYNIGDIVYYICNGKVKKGEISEIYITVKEDTESIKSRIVTLYSYGIKSPGRIISDRYSPPYVFKSKELAAKYAMELLDQLNKLD